MNIFNHDFDKLEVNVNEMIDCVEQCLNDALECTVLYLQEGESEEVRRLNKKVDRSESEADEYRRKIIHNILQGSLMPNTRADILNLIEAIDDIADNVEDILESIIFLNLDFCCINQEDLEEMISLLKQQFADMTRGVNSLFDEMSQALVYAKKLEEIESKIDDLEEKMTREIGQLPDITTGEKLIHRKLIKDISDIADVIEEVGDHIEIIISVRKG